MWYVVNVPFRVEEDRLNLIPILVFHGYFPGGIQTTSPARQNVFGQIVRGPAGTSSTSSAEEESQSTTPTSHTSTSPIPVPAPRATLQSQATVREAFHQRIQLIAQAGRDLDTVLTAVACQAALLGSLPLSDKSGVEESQTPELEVGREDGEEESEDEYLDSAFV